MPFADLYTFRARVQPALTVVLPLGFLLFAILPGYHLFVVALFGLLSTAGGTAVLAQFGRDRGREKQRELWAGWDGAPTTRLLRHRRIPGDIELTEGLRPLIEEWWGQPLPTEDEEEADPAGADARYKAVTAALRQATYDRSRFPLVFAENVNYGFRRNLWGLRPWGPISAAAFALVAWALFVLTVWGRPWPEPFWDVLVNPDRIAVIQLAVAVTNTAFAIFWLFRVNPSWVKPVAEAYAAQLMGSVRTLRGN